MHTGINFFLFHLSVTDDHAAYLGILRICRFTHKFLIDRSVIFIHSAFSQLAHGKISHAVPIAFVSLRILLFPGDDAGIKIRSLGISEIIVIISKIHKQRLRKYSSVRSVQCLYIIFIKTCDPDSPVYCRGKPAEIFCFSWISLHDIFTDRFYCVIRRKSLTPQYHSPVQAFIK